ncbi:putative lipoprotein [Mycoplasmopsis mustelae]|uniref:Putative lipoprotein n=1 Tax=Mycoplasmopsis mustelae TaxID=171289 RepID=A0A4R7UDE6_9BACT|nr:hypothetical protein [Mycoplasmopsis mustelae]TDV24508.1 putative lipoprotein [Mycoplasmopsis mustelae]
MRRKKFLIFASFTTITTTALVAGCGTQNQQPNKTDYSTTKAASDNKIVFSTPQSEVFPLTIALKKLIPLYNNIMKKNPDFLPIEFRPNSISKANTELELATQTEQYIKDNSDKLPNLILGNQTSAYIINKYNKLLDTSSILPASNFPTKLLRNHTELVGEQLNNVKLFNLPFDVSDTNGFSINIDLLNKALELAKQAGAIIDESGALFDYLKTNKDKGNSIPASSAINFLKPIANSLKGYKIDENTFKGLNSLFEFARKFHSAMDVDTTKVAEYGNNPINKLNVFSIDYQQDEFFKSLSNQLNGKQLWELEISNGKYDFSKIKWNIKDDTTMQQAFIKTFDNFVKNHRKTVGTKLFKDVEFKANGSSDWASWDMRQYQTIFAVVASVGLEQSIDSPTSRSFFGKSQDPKNWTTRDDVYLQKQVTKNNASDKNGTYIEGGSSLIPISVDNNGKEDKATKLFLTWLYKQEVVLETGEKILVRDLITRSSAYIIPLNQLINRGNTYYSQQEAVLKTKIEENQKLIENQTTSQENKQKYENENKQLTSAINYTHSGSLSYQSLNDFLNNSDYLLNLPSNEKTNQITKKIENMLLESTKNENPVVYKGSDVLRAVLDIINSK